MKKKMKTEDYKIILQSLINNSEFQAANILEKYKPKSKMKKKIEEFEYTWENCVYSGFIIDVFSKIVEIESNKIDKESAAFHIVFATEKDAESSIAHAQLTQIIRKLNTDWKGESGYDCWIYYDSVAEIYEADFSTLSGLPSLKHPDLLPILLKYAKPLLNNYFQI